VLVTRAVLDGTDAGDSLVTLFDITELKQAEKRRISLEGQLRESQKMQAIGTLAGGIAHDFNNIIAVVLGNVQLLLADAASDPRVHTSLEEIRKAGRRARDLVQQILSFSRRQVVELKPTSLLPVMAECEQMLRAILPARVELEVHCDPQTPAAIADANQVQQIVINLATNAMQAMQGRPGHVHIGLDAPLIDAQWVQEHPMADSWLDPGLTRVVRLTVRDDGHGMDLQTRSRIFEPFFTTKSTGEGTGLGLSVVHGIVQTHKGAIDVQSSPGQGTDFTIYLPTADGAHDLAPPGHVPTAAVERADVGAGRRILYIDDDEALAFLVRRLLTRRGFKVNCQTDPMAAVRMLRSDPQAFDLVVTDYNMPGMSGIDVVHEVRRISPDLLVAVISGFIDEELRSLASKADVQQLIFKASAVEDLCDVIVRILEPDLAQAALA
jgi:signal transduction histidine kinase/ActR/RegA family two-component response regulator